MAQLVWRFDGTVGLEVWWLIWWSCGGLVGEVVVARLVEVWGLSRCSSSRVKKFPVLEE